MNVIRSSPTVELAVDLILAELPQGWRHVTSSEVEYDRAAKTHCDECGHVGLFVSSYVFVFKRHRFFICPVCGYSRKVTTIIARQQTSEATKGEGIGSGNERRQEKDSDC